MFSRHRVRFLGNLFLPFLLLASLFAQAADTRNRPAELRELLRKLHTTARLMQTTAHPDDEDGGMLTLESRGKGADVLLLTLTRGEGGQNKVGSNLLDVLGELRTLELLAADQYYGVEQRFTRVADFGFSKTADETFQKWHGHDAALGDMVRVIRTFRPDVLVSRFSGTPRDGHGHHQASGILTIEAFHAAADPTRFHEQLKEGLPPWQAKKLYIGTRSPEDATVALSTGETDPLLGMSYAQYAMQGLKHQLSQGAGSWNLPPGPRFSYYKLADSVLPVTAGKHETDFFDGIETSLPGLATRLGQEETSVPFLRPALVELQTDIERATQEARKSDEAAAIPLLAGLKIANELIEKTGSAKLSALNKQYLLDNLTTKRAQLECAARLALGLEVRAQVNAPRAKSDEVFVAVPGQSFTVSLHWNFRGNPGNVVAKPVLELPAGWHATRIPEQIHAPVFRVDVPLNARLTRPYWHRDNPETDAIYRIDEPQCATLPFCPPALFARTELTIGGSRRLTVRIPVEVTYRDSANEAHTIPVAVAPALSVALEPAMRVLPVAVKDGADVKVIVQKNVPGAVRGTVRLQIPPGWRSEPASAALDLKPADQRASLSFHLAPGPLHEQRDLIRAVVDYDGRSYAEGYTVVARPDLGTAFYYQPATQRISVVNVKVPHDLKVGYIMGAGDDIPAILRQIGLDVALISEQELATGDLSRYATIILGIRAYDTREDVRKYNPRLLDYVRSGGTLLAQYNASVGEFNEGQFMPYSAEMSRDRVTVEEAPVKILDPQNPVFHTPNLITPEDFRGWVQERGLYFADSWDSHYQPLLESHDPGEPPLKGGLLYARYGKGTYIYTGYSFFRQLPAGVPGAIRLFVNLVSAGR